MAIHWDRRSYTEEEFIKAWNASSSIAECCRKLGVMQSGGAAKSFNRTARALGLSKDHIALRICVSSVLHVILTLQPFVGRIRRLLKTAIVALGYYPHQKNATLVTIRH